MAKQKILLSKWVPDICLHPYRDIFDITLPNENQNAFSYDTVKELLPDFDGYLSIDLIADKPLLDAAKKLKVIANFGVGYDKIDWQYATELGLPVLNTPTQVTESTAELAVALMMAAMRGIRRYDTEVRSHIWNSPLFADEDMMVFGSTLGIFGFGRIGRAVCKKAKGLGMNVYYYDPFRPSKEVEEEYGASYLPFDELLKVSDCITLHMPYTPENHHLFDRKAFESMKRSAYFINASRGKLVDEQALCEALQCKMIRGAGLDVYEQEPIVCQGLLQLNNVVMTPHVGTLTMRARVGMCQEALDGVAAVLNGELPKNCINPEVLQ